MMMVMVIKMMILMMMKLMDYNEIEDGSGGDGEFGGGLDWW